MRVLITREIPEAGVDLLKEHPDIEIDMRCGPPLSAEEMKKALKGVDAIIPVIPDEITADIIKAGDKLKIIAAYSVGYDHIDIEAATRQKVYISNTPGDLTESVAEHAFALMVAVGRRIVEADKFVRQGDYKYWDPMIFLAPQFSGKTLGIVGFGRIGKHLAKMTKNGLNMDILYKDIKRSEDAEKELGAKFVEMDELLEHSDVISLNCNLSEETRHLIGEKELRKMKPFAYIINTARGPIINEAALVTALEEEWIAGAGLDVFEGEPKLHEGLAELDNVVLTPHIASATREARIQMARMAAENVIDVLIENKAPENIVNKDLTQSLLADKSAPQKRVGVTEY